MQTLQKPSFEALSKHFAQWQKVGDLIDQSIDLMLNLRQSGHPGGSRSKVPLMVATTLGGVMRWDVRRPELPVGDRFVLVAGHCCPLVYGMLAVYNEALRIRYELTKDPRFLVPNAKERALVWEDLLFLRHVLAHLRRDALEEPRDVHQLGMPLAVHVGDFPGVTQQHRHGLPDEGVMRVDDVADELRRVPGREGRRLGGRHRQHPIEFAKHLAGKGARLAASMFDGPVAVAAEINAVALEHRGGSEISRDDLPDRPIERGSHESSLHDNPSRPFPLDL